MTLRLYHQAATSYMGIIMTNNLFKFSNMQGITCIKWAKENDNQTPLIRTLKWPLKVILLMVVVTN